MSEVAETEVTEEKPESKTSYDGAEIRSAKKEEVEEKPEKRAGYNPVDIETASPEQIKERVNYLYRQVKDGNKTVTQYRQIAAEQSRQIEELTKGYNGVISHLTVKNFEDAEKTALDALTEAFNKGDNKGYISAQKQYTEIIAKKTAASMQPKAEVRQQAAPQNSQAYGSASQVARDAESTGEFSPEETSYTSAWQNEKDENGNLLRPWAKTADQNNPDPEFRAALNEANGVFNNPRFANKSIEEKLAEVDRRMGVAKRTVSQTVSGGRLTGKPNSSKVTLSSDIERLAVRTKFGGPKAKTDAEHIEAYRQQLAKVKGKR